MNPKRRGLDTHVAAAVKLSLTFVLINLEVKCHGFTAEATDVTPAA
jgi:hypothetical protein